MTTNDTLIKNVGINIQEKSAMMWAVADVLRGPFKPHEYGLVILPFTVIKRFNDCLMPTHKAVLDTWEKVKKMAVVDGFMTQAAGYQFYNKSKFTFDSLLKDPENIEANFKDYIHGFSENVQDILAKFEFDNVIKRLVESNCLYLVIKEFNSEKGYLGPDKIGAVDCGYIFEDLVRRFSESYDDQAGAHFTSRDIIYLMTDVLLSDSKIATTKNCTVYDMAMGTSQMLSCMQERIATLNKETEVVTFGQEINPSTYGIAKADMMIRGGDPNNMRFGDTLSDDKFKGFTFDYIISNPPFGIDWKKEKAAVEKENKLGTAGRFAPGLPKISDGQQLFVLNGLAKLAPHGKMAIIQNGSPLFSGDAESGPSEIRRYILENDWLDCIIQLGTDMFMNTGISTYIWVLSKDRPAEKAGKVQLINASNCFEQRRKSIGTKRNDITDKCRELIVQCYGDYKAGVYGDKDGIYCESKIFDTTEFGYNKIIVERPLRQQFLINNVNFNIIQKDLIGEYTLSPNEMIGDINDVIAGKIPSNVDKMIVTKTKKQMANQKIFKQYLSVLKTFVSDKPYLDVNKIEAEFNKKAESYNLKFDKFYRVHFWCFSNNPNAEIVKDKKGKPVADKSLEDTESIPMNEDIDAYFKREVLPYAPDAWYDPKKTKVGYEIPMTRYFYEYQAPENVEDIFARVTKIEEEISVSLKALLGE